MQCPKCKSENYVKNGMARNKQRFLCKNCHYQFLEESKDEESKNLQRNALLLFLHGFSYRSIASILGVGHTLVYFWIKKWNELLVDLQRKNEPYYLCISEISQMLKTKEHVKNYRFVLLDMETDVVYISLPSHFI